MALNIVIFLSYQGQSPQGLNMFFSTWGMIPADVTAGQNWSTLFTSLFLHGGWMHLIGNMLYLWIFGDNMEDAFGHGPFLGFYMASGLLASAAQIAWDPASPIPNIGASGAIAGVLGGYLLLYPKARVDVLLFFVVIVRVIPIPAWIVLGAWMALQVFNGVMVDSSGGGVAYWAHAGGFAAGVILTLPFWIANGGPRFWNTTQGRPPHPESQYRIGRTRIPRVRRR